MEPILSKALQRDIDKMLYELNGASAVIEKAKECGLDCSEQDARCQQMKQFLKMAREKFGSQPGLS